MGFINQLITGGHMGAPSACIHSGIRHATCIRNMAHEGTVNCWPRDNCEFCDIRLI